MRYFNRHEEIVKACSSAETFTEVELIISNSTPNTSLRRYIKRNNIPMPNFLGQKAGNKKSMKSRKLISINDFYNGSNISSGQAKRFLFKNNIKEEKCEICGWNEKRESNNLIPIHLHHIDGNHFNWEIENIQILCPNHHALTENYAGCNNKYKNLTTINSKVISKVESRCIICNNVTQNLIFCSQRCHKINSRKVNRPSYEELILDLETQSYSSVGRKYGVSDNCIKKWLKVYNKNRI